LDGAATGKVTWYNKNGPVGGAVPGDLYRWSS
jgi:hypothetical protein